ncbi:MAG: DUF4399 domain-containing protein [Bacteroidota bacterium]|nr:DUF4399 domain-containing protein [Bacteroidota bacterium]
MKKVLSIPALLLMGLISCNSGSSSESSSSDSTQTTTTTVSADTSHAAMSTSTVDPLPSVPSDAKVFFKNLKDGQTVNSPLKVEMAATNIAVDSAGTIKPNSGHFHIIIDDGDSTASGEVVRKDSTHLHFGNAQKEATISLSPGKHRLALQFADGIHRSYGSKLASAITVDVKK